VKYVPQINIATGISMDYWNEYFPRSLRFYASGGRQCVVDTLRTYPVKQYEERFPPETYGHVVTRKNRTRVARLNRLARYANSNFTDPDKFDDKKFERLLDTARRLVYGH
jgi:hypothetical protein